MSIDTLKAAAMEVSANERAPCEKCMDQAELQAVILFPALGTPYIAPASEKTIKVYLIAEQKCVQLFDILGNGKGKTAPLAWYVLNSHLRLTAFKDEHKTSADIKGDSLYASHAAAQKGIKVWYRGTYTRDAGASTNHWGNAIHDHQGRLVAHLRQSAVDFFVGATASYGALAPAHALDRKEADTSNQPLSHLFEIELSLDGLKVKPAPDKAFTLSWMVTNVYGKAKTAGGRPVLPGVGQWEHQDKLIYDFLAMMKQRKQHFANPFAFDIANVKSDSVLKQFSDEANRLKAYHPVMFSTKPVLHLGHLTDVHISSRQFALARSEAQAIPGVSDKLGPKVTNCFSTLKELFDNVRTHGADAIFMTGDLLDFNQNMDPSKLATGAPKDQWGQFDLSRQFSGGRARDAALYPRGIDDMLAYSLLKYSYLHDCPVFMTTGNHEAYDVPFGISPRLGAYGSAGMIKQTLEVEARAKKIAALRKQAAELRAAGNESGAAAKESEANLLQAEQPVVPRRVKGLTVGADQSAANAHENFDEYLKNPGAYATPEGDPGAGLAIANWLADKWDAMKAPKQEDGKLLPQYDPEGKLANEGIPADHNLTIYEACMAYGPSYNNILKSWNFTPANLDWFFMIFTPLADYSLTYGDKQCFIGLDWGDSEIMVNTDLGASEAWQGDIQLSGLPRADKSLSGVQTELIAAALKGAPVARKNILFSHFTLLNYENGVPLDKPMDCPLEDHAYGDFNRGTFTHNRQWLFGLLNDGNGKGRLHYTLSGHSHRAAVYGFNHLDGEATRMRVRGYEPQEPGDDDDYGFTETFKYSGGNTRVIVSSCGGPIGGQNYSGELFGWNLQPPSAGLLKSDKYGVDEVRRIIAKQSSAKPRFCVALDYIETYVGKPVIRWVAMQQTPNARSSANVRQAQYWMVLDNVLFGGEFVAKVEFFVWSAAAAHSGQRSSDASAASTGGYRSFAASLSKLSATDGSKEEPPRIVYGMTLSDEAGFYAAAARSAKAPAFARITFNQSLKVRSCYSQFNFDDPWVFPIKISARHIARPSGLAGQVPDFRQLGAMLPDSYHFEMTED